MATVWYFWHGFIHRGTTFMCFQYSRPPYLKLPNVWKAPYTIIASIFVDVPYWPLYSWDKFISCVVPGPSQWFFLFGEEIVIARIHWVSTEDVPESPIAGGSRDLWQQQRCDSLHCHEEWWGSVTPSVVVFSWVHAITISSPKWKNHCESPGTTQEMNLSVLRGGQYGTSTKMDALMVYDTWLILIITSYPIALERMRTEGSRGKCTCCTSKPFSITGIVLMLHVSECVPCVLSIYIFR